MDNKDNLEKDPFLEMFLETHHLMHTYNLIWYRKNFGGIDPRQGQGRILSALRRMQSISQKELGYILDIRPQSLGELLQKLEANGYIKRHRSPTDKRALIVELTEKGEYFQLQRPDYNALFVDLSEDDKRLLTEAFDKITVRLTEQIDMETAEDFY